MKPVRLLILLSSLTLLWGKPKFSDTQLLAMTPPYFTRNHTAPKLLGTNIYMTRQGRVFRVDIHVDRNRANDDLGFAFSALTTLAQYAQKPFKEFIVVMHYDIRDKPPEVVIGKARCTLNRFVYQRISYAKWYQECIRFQQM